MRRINSYVTVLIICAFFNLMLYFILRLPSKNGNNNDKPSTEQLGTDWAPRPKVEELLVPNDNEEDVISLSHPSVPFYFRTFKSWRKYLHQLRPRLRPNLTNVVFSDNKLKVIAIVNSALCHQKKRQAIRQTWGSELRKLGGHLFFIIGKLSNMQDKATFQSKYQSCWNSTDYLSEAAKESDLIQYDFIDNYYNMTFKSLLVLKFFNEDILGLRSDEIRFSNRTTLNPAIASLTRKPIFLLKTDDDVLVNVSRLFKLLTKYTEDFKVLKTLINDENGPSGFHKLLVGRLLTTARPYRDPKSRFYTPPLVYKKPIYPHYLLGSGFVASAPVTRALFGTIFFSKTCPYNPFDDLYLTGFCAPQAYSLLDDYTLNPRIRFGIKPKDNFDVIAQYSNTSFTSSSSSYSSSSSSSLYSSSKSTGATSACCNCFEGLVSSHDLSPLELQSLWRKRV